jgi:hypothetical protein
MGSNKHHVYNAGLSVQRRDQAFVVLTQGRVWLPRPQKRGAYTPDGGNGVEEQFLLQEQIEAKVKRRLVGESPGQPQKIRPAPR